MIELLEHPLSPYAQKIKIALVEKGVDFTVAMPQAIGSGNTPEAFRAANPRGEVPVLFVDGQPIFDSTIILEYVEDAYPEPALMPADPMARAKARMIEEVIDTHYEAITWGLSEIANFKRATGEQAEAMQAKAGEQLARLHGWLDRQLGQGPWFGGETFGWADACVAPFVQGAAGFGFGPAAGSALDGWLKRVRARPSCVQSFEQARASLEAMAQVAGIVEAGLFKRQYRDYRLEWMIRSGGVDVVLKGLEKSNIRFNEEPA